MDNVLQLVPAPPPKPKWTPRELLLDMVKEIDEGKIEPTCLMVFFMESLPNGNIRPCTWSANISRAEAIAFCELEKQRTLEAWKNG